jgi:hypothetical protein
MDYVMCYYRPENKFPDRVFGGFARSMENMNGCATDLFCYLPYTGLSLGTKLPSGWHLNESTAADMWELSRFYNHQSGGLLLDAMGLSQDYPGDDGIRTLYQRLGFFRRFRVYSLSNNKKLMAVLILNQSNLGFNLSELLNGIKILVTSPEDLPWEILSAGIAQITGKYHMSKIPVMFYPSDYVLAKKIPFEKLYQLWILNVQYGNEYMTYMNKKFRISFS